jgi:hypothetical protein
MGQHSPPMSWLLVGVRFSFLFWFFLFYFFFFPFFSFISFFLLFVLVFHTPRGPPSFHCFLSLLFFCSAFPFSSSYFVSSSFFPIFSFFFSSFLIVPLFFLLLYTKNESTSLLFKSCKIQIFCKISFVLITFGLLFIKTFSLKFKMAEKFNMADVLKKKVIIF